MCRRVKYKCRDNIYCSIRNIIGLILFVLSSAVYVKAQVAVIGTQSVIPQSQTASPYGVVVDSAGNLYVSDTQKGEILCFSSTGTACGIPFPIEAGLIRPEGMAIDENNNLFVADAVSGEVLEIIKTPTGYGNPVILASSLSSPCGVALDPSDNLFVVASGSGEVYELPKNTGKYGSIRLVVGNLDSPSGIAIDYSYYLYIAQTGKSVITRYAATAEGYASPLNILSAVKPDSVAVDTSLNIYISDLAENNITSYGWNYRIAHPISAINIGTGLNSPGQIAVAKNGTIYIADTGNNRLIQFASSIIPFSEQILGANPAVQSFVLSIAGGTTIGSYQVFTNGRSGGDFNLVSGGTCATGLITSTTTCTVNVAFNPQYSGLRKGAILVEDDNGNVLCDIYVSGTGVTSRIVALPATMSTIVSGLNAPTGLALDDSGNLYVADAGNNQIYKYEYSGSSYQAPSILPVYAMNSPQGIAIDGSGNLYIASSGNDRVIKFTWNGQSFVDQVSVGTGMYVPSDVAIGKDGTMCVANTYENQVDCYAWNGNNYTPLTSEMNYVFRSPYETSYPLAVAIDSQHNIYWTQPYYNVVTEAIASRGTLENYLQYIAKFPNSISFDGEDNLYVLDSGNNRVLMLISNGASFQPPIVVASGLNAPQGMTIDSAGNIYVADTGNHRIVKITMSQAAQTQFSSTYAGTSSSTGTQSIRIFNLGGQAATLNSIVFPPDFTSGTSTASACASGSVLAQNQSCAIAVEFLPQSAGNSINEAITYSVSSGSGSRKTYSIPVSGVSENKISQNITFRVVSQVSYGQNSSTGPNSIQLVATSTSELAVQFSVLNGPGSIVPGSSILQVLGAGAIIIKASQAGNGEYGPAPDVVQTVNVMPALLTVTASSKQVTYGESIGSCEYTITGFVQGDSAATSVSGNPVISCGSGTLPSIGSYSIQISQGTLSSGNYQFIFVPGMLTVSPALLRVIPRNASNLYGDLIPSLSYSIAGFIGSDNVAVVSGSPVLTTSATRQSNVGSYPIQCSMGTLRAVNYSFICQSGTLLITPATLRIAPGAQSFVYGASVPALSYTISGLVNGDTASVIQGSPVLSTPATEHSSVGNYPILCNAGTMHSLNYIVSCSSSAITVTKRVLSVNAVSPNVVYGSLMPEMKYSFSGFVNGDQSSNAIGGAPSAASSYLSESTVGTYPIIISSGTLSSVNYAFAFGPATLTVFPATLYLAPNDLTLLSGSSIPPLTYTAYGLINGETLATATTGSPSLTTTATSSSMPGKYPIIMLQGTLRSPNYTIICMNRTLTILSSSAQGNGGLNGGSPPPVPVHGKPLLPHTGGAVNEEKGYAVSSTPFAGITVWNGTGLTADSAVTLTDDATSTSYTATTNSTDAGSLIHQNKFCDQMVSGLMLNIQKSLDVSMHDSDKENCSEVSGKSADKSNVDSTITER